MVLPRRGQRLAKLIPIHDLTRTTLAVYLEITPAEVDNLCKGLRYPTPREVGLLEKVFDVPIEQVFEPAMLVHRDATEWPPKGRGFRPVRQS